MTKNPPDRRRTSHPTRRIRLTTHTDNLSSPAVAQIFTKAALQRALLEAEAEAEHADSANGRTPSRTILDEPEQGASRA